MDSDNDSFDDSLKPLQTITRHLKTVLTLRTHCPTTSTITQTTLQLQGQSIPNLLQYAQWRLLLASIILKALNGNNRNIVRLNVKDTILGWNTRTNLGDTFGAGDKNNLRQLHQETTLETTM
jgi:hypothetical protein